MNRRAVNNTAETEPALLILTVKQKRRVTHGLTCHSNIFIVSHFGQKRNAPNVNVNI